MAEWKRICCAIDFSEPSRRAMETAANLARRLEADLALLHVYETHAPSPEVLLANYEQALPEIERNMREAQVKAERIAGKPVRTMIFTGHAADEIVRLAAAEPFDLLVLSTHGRSGLAHLVLGSVAERVVRQARCPVIVVPGVLAAG